MKASPTCALLYCQTSVKKSGHKNQLVNAPTMAKVTAMLETVNDRIRKSAGSNKGSECLDDRKMNKGKSVAANPKHPKV